jgi:hypothetical protein
MTPVLVRAQRVGPSAAACMAAVALADAIAAARTASHTSHLTCRRELAIQLRRDVKPQLDAAGVGLYLVSIGTWERSIEFAEVTGFPRWGVWGEGHAEAACCVQRVVCAAQQACAAAGCDSAAAARAVLAAAGRACLPTLRAPLTRPWGW